jgi:hypothetical protein
MTVRHLFWMLVLVAILTWAWAFTRILTAATGMKVHG